MKKDLSNKIIIVGPACSGKNFLFNRFINQKFKPGLLHTTRPRRNWDDDDYHFTNDKEFNLMKRENLFITETEFNNWQYGLLHSEWENNNLFILAPYNIKQLKEMGYLSNSFIIYIKPDWSVLHARLLERNDNNDSIERRMKADIEDFTDFIDYNIKITNPDF